jgi:hypothetical protein
MGEVRLGLDQPIVVLFSGFEETPLALKAATNVPSWRGMITMSGSDASS